MFRTFIVLALSWVIITEAPAGVKSRDIGVKPSGILVLERLDAKFNDAWDNPALQQVTAENALRAIITLRMPADADAAESKDLPSAPPPSTSVPKPERFFELMKDRFADSYETTFYIQWIMKAWLAKVNIGSILDVGRRLSQESKDPIYIGHVQACYIIYALIEDIVKPVPTMIVHTPIARLPQGTRQALGEKYRYYDTKLNPKIGFLNDVAAEIAVSKAIAEGKDLKISIKTGFIKFFDTVKVEYYGRQAFPSMHAIAEGVLYQLTPVVPSGTPTFAAPTWHVSKFTLVIDPAISYAITAPQAPWIHQQFTFTYDGYSLVSCVSEPPRFALPTETGEEKEIKDTAERRYPINPGFLLRQNPFHNPNLAFMNRFDTSGTSYFILPPPDNPVHENLHNGLGLYSNSSVFPQPYVLEALRTRIYTSLAALSPHTIVFTCKDPTPAPHLILVRQTDAGTLREEGEVKIGTGNPLSNLTKGPNGILYLFERKGINLNYVHILNDTDLNPAMPEAHGITCNFDTLVGHTLTLQRNLIVAGTRGDNTIISIIRLSQNKTTLKWSYAVEELRLGTYRIRQILCFPEVTHTDAAGVDRIIPSNITVTGPDGTLVIPIRD